MFFLKDMFILIGNFFKNRLFLSSLNEISKSIGQHKGLFTSDVSNQRGGFQISDFG